MTDKTETVVQRVNKTDAIDVRKVGLDLGILTFSRTFGLLMQYMSEGNRWDEFKTWAENVGSKKEILAQSSPAAVASDPTEDPIVQKLKALTWDVEPRLGSWLHVHFGAPKTKKNADIGTQWFIDLVACKLNPGQPLIKILMLEAPESFGVRDALREIADVFEPKESLFRDLVEGWLTSADLIEMCVQRQCWIFLDPSAWWRERHSFLGPPALSSEARVYAYMAGSYTRNRAPFASEPANIEPVKRNWLAVTVRETDYRIHEPERFNVVKCNQPNKRAKVDIDAFKADIPQLLAEAVWLHTLRHRAD